MFTLYKAGHFLLENLSAQKAYNVGSVLFDAGYDILVENEDTGNIVEFDEWVEKTEKYTAIRFVRTEE